MGQLVVVLASSLTLGAGGALGFGPCSLYPLCTEHGLPLALRGPGSTGESDLSPKSPVSWGAEGSTGPGSLRGPWTWSWGLGTWVMGREGV